MCPKRQPSLDKHPRRIDQYYYNIFCKLYLCHAMQLDFPVVILLNLIKISCEVKGNALPLLRVSPYRECHDEIDINQLLEGR